MLTSFLLNSLNSKMTGGKKSIKFKFWAETTETSSSQNNCSSAQFFFYPKSACSSVRLIIWGEEAGRRNYSVACTSN